MRHDDTRPVIWWVRRDMRLADNAALTAAAETGAPVIPVFLHDGVVAAMGAMPRWRMLLGAGALADSLAARGSRLILRRGPALEGLRALVAETGAQGVYWSRLVDPEARARDEAVKAALRADGVAAHSFPGHVLFEPWTVATGSGGYYRVYTPFWRTVKDREVGDPLPVPARLPVPGTWPPSDRLDDWRPAAGMDRGAAVVRPHLSVGEDAARARLDAFICDWVVDYADARERPGVAGTSRLSENLTLGEISARSCWQAGLGALERGGAGAETFLKELAWRAPRGCRRT